MKYRIDQVVDENGTITYVPKWSRWGIFWSPFSKATGRILPRMGSLPDIETVPVVFSVEAHAQDYLDKKIYFNNQLKKRVMKSYPWPVVS